MGHLVFAMAAAVSVLAGAARPDDQATLARQVGDVMHAYLEAWDRADARAIAAQFAPDGDFINPDGFYARGPGEVEAFYQSAFDHGYAGRAAGFTLKAVRRIAPGVVAVDGVWSIAGARSPEGRASPQERGLATAVLVRRREGWRLALLREQSSAQDVEIPAAH